ncbi:MAG: hypothetical protein ACKO7B_08875, partial [Flavobacteriales bacterium]
TTDDPTGPCTIISGTATVTISEVSTANAGGDYSTCGGNSVDVSASGGTGTWSVITGAGSFADNASAATTFIPAAGSTGAIVISYQVADPDDAGPCDAVSDNATIQIYAPPSASFSNTTACEGVTINLQAASSTATGLWTSSVGGTFSINPPNIPNINYSPPLNVNSVNLTWTTLDPDGANGPCVAVSASATLTVNSQVEGTLEPLSYVTCGAAPVDVQVNSTTSGTWSVSPGLGTFSPNNSNSTTFTPQSGANQIIDLIWTSNDPAGPCPALELNT